MKGAGEGSELLLENSHPDQSRKDDEFMEYIDPSKMDIVEDEASRDRVVAEMRARISPQHQTSYIYEAYTDEYLNDCILTDNIREMDQALWDASVVVMEEWEGTFARNPKNPGTTSKIEHGIDLKPGAEMPKSMPMFRRSKPDRELIAEWINWMLHNGMIERSQATSFQNLLVIRKPGKEPRVCFDARAVNSITISDEYPPHRIDALLARLKYCVIFSSLDAASGFWQIPIKEKDRHKTAFRTELGVFHFLVMPFGLKNAPATFTRFMTESFQGLHELMKIYMDDLLIHSRSITNHPKHLRKIFQTCRENGIKLRLSKCEFLKEEVRMLGYKVNSLGITKNHDKIEAILQYGILVAGKKRLVSIAQLRCFVGMCQWYRTFHHMFADQIQVLTDLLKKGKSVKKDWNKDHQMAFENLKSMLAEKSLLYYPDESKPFLLQTDASAYAIGGALMQLQLLNGEEIYHVVEFFSRSLIARERNYSVSEKEFLAILVCTEKWKHYLWQKFSVITDHKPLLSMTTTDKARLQRWALRLTPFDFTIAWSPGVEMALPDALSRDPGLDVLFVIKTECPYGTGEKESFSLSCQIRSPPDKSEGTTNPEETHTYFSHLEEDDVLVKSPTDYSDEPPVFEYWTEPLSSEHLNKLATSYHNPTPLSVSMVYSEPTDEKALSLITIHPTRRIRDLEAEGERLLDQITESWGKEITTSDILRPGTPSFFQEQRLDERLQAIINQIEKRKTPLLNNDAYFICPTTGLLMWRNKEGANRIVVPDQMVNNILWLHHEHPLAGHPMGDKMMQSIRTTFYIPHLRKRVKDWVDNCQCTRAKAKMRGKAGLTLSRPIPEIFAWVVIDIVGAFPRSRRGNTYWLTLMDPFTKDLELIPLRGKSAPGIAKAILEHWICRRGCPRVLLSDNAKEFLGNIVKDLCKMIHVHHQTVTAYHHPSQGLIERVHSYAESILRSSRTKTLSEWDTWLPFIRFAIMTHEIDNSGVSPFQVVYGLKPILPADLSTGTVVIPTSMREYYKTAQEIMTKTRTYFRVQRAKTRITNRLKRDRLDKRFRSKFEVGQDVFVTRPSYTRQDGVKAIAKIIGPFRGPYKVAAVDSHNGVDVDIDGEIKHFNVSQINISRKVLDRPPPVYDEDTLVPQPPASGDKTQSIPMPTNSARGDDEGKRANKKHTKPKTTSSKTTEKLMYQIHHDTMSQRNYATQLINIQDIVHIMLFATAKNNDYHPIWFSSENPDKSVASKSKPKPTTEHPVWEKWIIPRDSTWIPIGKPQLSLKKLDRKVLKSNKPSNT